MKHVQECKNIRAGAMIVIFNYREDEKQERNKCKTSASESAAFQVLQQPAVAGRGFLADTALPQSSEGDGCCRGGFSDQERGVEGERGCKMQSLASAV